MVHFPPLVCPTGYGAWLHGEAVAAGTMMAADMSRRLGWIDDALVQRIRALNEQAKLPVAPPPVRGIQTLSGGRAFTRDWGVGTMVERFRTLSGRSLPHHAASAGSPCSPMPLPQTMTVE